MFQGMQRFFCGLSPLYWVRWLLSKREIWGELLTTVARDVNDQMLPLAYAIVEVENKETWKWFLEILVGDLGGPGVCGACAFMSDQQKLLINIFLSIHYLLNRKTLKRTTIRRFIKSDIHRRITIKSILPCS